MSSTEPKSGLVDRIITETSDENRIVTDAPTERFRLNYFDVACLVINRMIGVHA